MTNFMKFYNNSIHFLKIPNFKTKTQAQINERKDNPTLWCEELRKYIL